MEKIKIMSYNVQWFSGINSQTEMQKTILNKYHAHIIGLQELSTNGKINKVGRTVLADYPHQYISKHKNYLGLASKYALTYVKSRDFDNQDPQDMEQYGETRAYMTAKLKTGNKTITIINTHLCYLTQEIKFKQMQEIFDLMQQNKYCICMGDFNCFTGEEQRMFGQFIDAGYSLANCADKITKTWTFKTNPKGLSQFTYATDNIIVSPNIRIKKTYFDRTKIKSADGNPMDHIPIVSRLYIQ